MSNLIQLLAVISLVLFICLNTDPNEDLGITEQDF